MRMSKALLTGLPTQPVAGCVTRSGSVKERQSSSCMASAAT